MYNKHTHIYIKYTYVCIRMFFQDSKIAFFSFLNYLPSICLLEATIVHRIKLQLTQMFS